MDEIDYRILKELQQDGRQTHQQLSDQVAPCCG
ncbi:MAG: AsnC family transcriptional regulator [Mangrovicoccus sp.]